MRSRLPTAVRQNLEIKELNSEISRLREQVRVLRELLGQVRDNARIADLMGARDEDGNFLDLDTRIDAALESTK